MAASADLRALVSDRDIGVGGGAGRGEGGKWRRRELGAEGGEEMSRWEEEEDSRVCAEMAARVGRKMGWGGGGNGSVVDLEEEMVKRVKELEFSLEKMRGTEQRFAQVEAELHELQQDEETHYRNGGTSFQWYGKIGEEEDHELATQLEGLLAQNLRLQEEVIDRYQQCAHNRYAVGTLYSQLVHNRYTTQA